MRITGGRFASRALRAPRGMATRPTTDRVREALFSILASAGVLERARVLDLYAGTGALALEALSRGAAFATLVESSREALSAIVANVEALGLEGQTHVIGADVRRAVARSGADGPFDLVLADPPWSQGTTGAVVGPIEELLRAGAFSPDALLVLEHAARARPPDLAGLELGERRRYGDTALAFYKVAILAATR